MRCFVFRLQYRYAWFASVCGMHRRFGSGPPIRSLLVSHSHRSPQQSTSEVDLEATTVVFFRKRIWMADTPKICTTVTKFPTRPQTYLIDSPAKFQTLTSASTCQESKASCFKFQVQLQIRITETKSHVKNLSGRIWARNTTKSFSY